MMPLLRCALLIPLLLATFAVEAALSQAPAFHARDLNGRSVESLSEPGVRAIVLIFAATDCPISNRYVPEITRMEKEFSAKGVRFWWVFPNPGDTIAAVRKHELDYSIPTKAILDEKQDLVQLAHVAVTPEAAVFSIDRGNLREAYHGRIDDLYSSFGQQRPAATHHDLEDAIGAILVGHTAAPAAHGPVGCSIIPVAMVNQSK
jgi:AhpC/TSA family